MKLPAEETVRSGPDSAEFKGPKGSRQVDHEAGSRWVHERFGQQARRSPDRVAVEFHGATLTYTELDVRSNRLANYLKTLGIGREGLVGLRMERSLEMLVALLGVLKAGGAYLPLDPALPTDRVDFMLKDARPRVLITQAGLLADQSDYRSNRADSPRSGGAKPFLLSIDRDWLEIERHSSESPVNAVDGESLFCVLYTSGSTGRPKGVQILHRAMANLLESMQQSPGLTEKDIWLAVTTLSFDIAGLEMYLPLLSGAKVVIETRDVARDGKRLAAALERSGATVLQGTPATWRLLIGAGWRGDGRLKMLSGGEALPRSLANELLQRGGELWNLYGPTETTVYSTGGRVTPGSRTVTIGRPIRNTQAFVLDEDGRRVSEGEAGELYLGGVGLARGYLNRPELTDERFVPNPFNHDGDSPRLYRTGDLVRRLPGGELEYLGRIDRQVKIRGFRIEPGEIEAALEAHPQVRQCVVTTHDSSGHKQLVAYVICADLDDLPTTGDLRGFLAQKLPDYMVPGLYVFLEALPLTSSGKVDRQALPPPESSRLQSTDVHVSARDPLERTLVAIWEEVLGRGPIGIRDNFFDLGGDSLLTVNLLCQIEKRLGQTLSPAMLFHASTIESLARVMRAEATEADGCVPLQPLGDRPPLFCLNWTFLYRHLAQALAPDQPVYGVYCAIEEHLRAAARGKPVTLSVEDLARQYLALILKTQPRGPYHLAGISFGGVLAFEVAQQLVRAGERVAFLGILDSILPGSYRALPYPQVRRAIHHFRATLQAGPSYLWNKLHTRLERQRQTRQQKAQASHERASTEISASRIEELRVWFMDELARRYHPTAYPGDAVLIRVTEREPAFDRQLDETLGWSQWVAGKLMVEKLAGTHNSLREEHQAPSLARIVRQHIAFASHRSAPLVNHPPGTHAPSATPALAGFRDTASLANAGQKALLLLTWLEGMSVL